MSPTIQLSPKDGYRVTIATILSVEEEQVINQLYTPIIGANALALFHTLYGDVDRLSYWTDLRPYSNLIAILSLDLVQLYDQICRLEAVGLLRSFQSIKEEGLYYHYLQKPASPTQFFNDGILSTTLLESVGANQFVSLQNRFRKQKIDLNHCQEVSHKFYDVFQMPNRSSYQEREGLIEELGQPEEVEPQLPKLATNNFDWPKLKAYLKANFISEDLLTNEVKKMLVSLKETYQVDEEVLGKHLIEATDFTNRTVSLRTFQDAVYESYSKKEPQPPKTYSQGQEGNQPKKKPSQSSDPMSQLIKSADEISVIDFARGIKEQKNGFLSNGEARALNGLVQREVLPSSVINILIHYILVQQNNSSLNKNLVDTIANDWAQNKISTAKEAMDYVRNKFEERAKPKLNRQASKKNLAEPIPDWYGKEKSWTPIEKETDQVNELTTDGEELKDLLDKLNREDSQGGK